MHEKVFNVFEPLENVDFQIPSHCLCGVCNHKFDFLHDKQLKNLKTKGKVRCYFSRDHIKLHKRRLTEYIN